MEEEKSFYEHIEEIRKRLLSSVIAVIVFSVLVYYFREALVDILIRPLGRELVFLSLTEPFTSYIKISLISGIIISFPYVLYQVLKFISVSLSKENQKKILKYIFSSLILFYGSIVFCYFMVLPLVIDFLISFEGSLVSSITFSNYLDFVILFLLGFGIMFQFPLVLLAVINLGLIRVETLKKNRAYIVVAILLISAILSPPDAFSLILLAFPLIVLFELILLISRNKGKN